MSFAHDFLDRAQRLDAADFKRAMAAINALQKNPDSNGLRLKQLAGGLKGLWSIRAAQDVRVLLARRNDSFVALDAGPRQDIYDRASRGAFVVNPATQFIGFVEAGGAQAGGDHPASTQTVPVAADGPRPFDHWTDGEFANAGIPAELIASLRSLGSPDDLLDLDVDEARLDELITMLEVTPDEWAHRLHTAADQLAVEDEARLVEMVGSYGALAGLSPFMSHDEIERLLHAPIEKWMLFLHPDQQSVVEKRFNGPARIRGSAGTGKTVVLLHRAAELTQRYANADDKILVTTYIKSLPPVLEGLFEQLPKGDPSRVEFVHVDKVARDVCKSAELSVTTIPDLIEKALTKAWRKVVTTGSPIERAGLSRGYVAQEITAVIKGRGMSSLSLYLNAKRTGRKTPLSKELRTQIWELREAWDDEMSVLGTVDFCDVIIKARDIARQADEATYRCILIDEAQDLTLAGLQMLRALVNGPNDDRPDGLLLAGDGAQRIYSGGFTLQQAGLDVRGRSHVLRKNYRNTAEVLAAALAVIGAAPVEDLDENIVVQDEVDAADRSGALPELVAAATADDQVDKLIARISALALDESNGVGLGDIAVCCPTNRSASVFRSALQAAGLPAIDLQEYQGATVEAVKVGTHDRAKGLEFKVVVLPDLSASTLMKPPKKASDAELDDLVATTTARLYVAMTRARDHLILGAVGDVSPVLDPALERFSLVT